MGEDNSSAAAVAASREGGGGFARKMGRMGEALMNISDTFFSLLFFSTAVDQVVTMNVSAFFSGHI